MQLMLTNMGTVPLPMASSEEGGWAEYLPCGIRVAFGHPLTAGFTLGYDPAATNLGVRDATEDLTAKYKTYAQGWVGRDSVPAGTEIAVDVLVECFEGDVTVEVGAGSMTREPEPSRQGVVPAGGSLRVQATNFAVVTGTASGGGGGEIPPPVDVTGTVTAFTAANPTAATMDAEDQGMLEVGSAIMLEALTGDQAAMDAINGQLVEVLSVTPTVTLGIDLSTFDVTGLTADFAII